MTATTRTILAVDLGKHKIVACVNDPPPTLLSLSSIQSRVAVGPAAARLARSITRVGFIDIRAHRNPPNLLRSNRPKYSPALALPRSASTSMIPLYFCHLGP
jgi:hypothetical protein